MGNVLFPHVDVSCIILFSWNDNWGWMWNTYMNINFCDSDSSLYCTDKIKNYSLDYISQCNQMQLLKLYYDMSEEEIDRYMYFYGG